MLPPIPLPPSPISNLSLFLSLPVCRRERGERAVEEPNHTKARKPWPIYKSFDTLCLYLYLYAGNHRSTPRRKPPSEPLKIKLLARLSLTYIHIYKTYHIEQGIAILGSKNSWPVFIYLDQLSFMLVFFRGKENTTHGRQSPKKLPSNGICGNCVPVRGLLLSSVI